LLVGVGYFGTQITQIEQIYTDNNLETSPQITQIYTDNNLETSPQITQIYTDNKLAGADLQSVPTTNAPITNRREQNEQNENKQTNINHQPTNKNQQTKTNKQQTTNNKQYFASLSASSSPTAFGKIETSPRRMFISSIKGDNAIMRNIDTETKYDLPFTFAFTFGIPLAKRLYLNTGVQYTYIHSKTEKFDSDTRDLISRDNQELHYLGVPLLLSYRIIDKNIFKLYVSGGGVIEKGLLETHNIQNFNETSPDNITVLLDDKNRKIEGLQFSLNANFGASITLVKGLALYAEPGLAWYIPDTKHPQPASRRTKNPFFVSITAGLRFDF